MVSRGQFVGLDWSRNTRLHSQVMTGTHELTMSVRLEHGESWVQIPSGTQIFSEVSINSISCCCYFISGIKTPLYFTVFERWLICFSIYFNLPIPMTTRCAFYFPLGSKHGFLANPLHHSHVLKFRQHYKWNTNWSDMQE